MSDNKKEKLNNISELFESQSLAVLSTQKNDQPYSSLVAFAASSDLESVYFLTPNTTRKYENLITNPKVTILVNNSVNQADDIYNAISVTGIGTAAVAAASDRTQLLNVYLKKHPHLKGFSKAPTTAFICVSMKRYFMVNQFQNVVEIQVNS
ncbi:pyridoxamine 5'-phosphate oxidase family protein [Desulfobacula sp.]|uniref:pyridoxamine 5'-phosphate oxidase family protein n=1 Tax=Desulfobacula sp. TaxID=2593537 RepID=UPI00260890BF|nr:pyridoxamine 5'-phosphate oxidase family protein [Desulfobacula sp.]